MADCDLPGVSEEQILGAQQRVIEACSRMTAEGTTVRFLRSIWVPEDWRVMHMFEAPDAAAVQAVSRAAMVPFLRVIEAMDLAAVP